MPTREERYIEAAALLLNRKRAGELTREEFQQRSDSLAHRYKGMILRHSNKVEYTAKLMQKVKARADELEE